MVTQYKLKPKVKKTEPPNMFHYVCCDDNVSLCGQDVSAIPHTDGTGEQHCVVCTDMLDNDTPCRSECNF